MIITMESKHYCREVLLVFSLGVSVPLFAQGTEATGAVAEETDTAATEAADTVDDDSASTDTSTNSNAEQKVDSTEAEAPREEKRKAPGSFDIDEEAATRALERSLVQINALLLPLGKAELALNFGFSSNSTNSPIIVEVFDPATSETRNALGVAQFERRNYEATISANIGLPYDTQFGLNLPFLASNIFSSTTVDSMDSGNTGLSSSGIGDLSLSLLKTVSKEKGRRPDIIARFSIDLDTGENSANGISTGSNAVEYTFGVSATKRQDPLVFTYQLSHTIAAEKDNFQPGDVTQLSLGAILAASPYTSIKFSFVQAIVGKSSINGESIQQINRAPASISLGTSSVVGKSVFVYTDIATGVNDAALDYQLTVGLSRQFNVF